MGNDEGGSCIETPKTKPCDHAFVFKIARRQTVLS